MVSSHTFTTKTWDAPWPLIDRATSWAIASPSGVNPPGTRTDRMTTLLRSEAQQKLGDPERWPELTKHLPFGRPAEPEEVADTIARLEQRQDELLDQLAR